MGHDLLNLEWDGDFGMYSEGKTEETEFLLWCITSTVALTWINTLLQRPAFTSDFATQRAAYAAERSTLEGSFPEKAPPPWAPQPP